MSSPKIKSIRTTAFAPASIGNVGVGFDILGLAIDGVGDTVELTTLPGSNTITISFDNHGPIPPSAIPVDPKKNTAGAALLTMQEDLHLPFGFKVKIRKGIPLGSGMGGSAASAVAAVVAAAKIVRTTKLTRKHLFSYALEGERIVSGAAHPDNVAPSLYGGLTLSSPLFARQVKMVPLPRGLFCALVHPDVQVETKLARQILRPNVDIQSFVHQSALVAGFILGCSSTDFDLIGESLRDLVIEPQRQHLIPVFENVKRAAYSVHGCLGFSISGSGPSVFALARSQPVAKKIAHEISTQFRLAGVTSQAYISRLPARGARLVPNLRALAKANK